MSTLAEIGFSIRNQVKGFFQSDDERIDIELIYKMVRQIRSVLIRERYKETQTVDDQMYQRICCIEVQCRNIQCNGVDSGVIEYYAEIPSLESLGGIEIKYVGTADMLHEFKYRNWSAKLYGDYSPWTGNKPFYTQYDSQMILGNMPTKGMKYICMIVLLDDPIGTGCYLLTENDQYPISGNMIHQLELIAIKQLMSSLKEIPDMKNNASEISPIDQNIKST